MSRSAGTPSGRGPFSDREQHPLPCLLLLDLKLPVKSGFEVLHWVRAQPEFHDLKVVILSGSEQSSDVTLARAFGVVDYIVKPASLGILRRIVVDLAAFWRNPGFGAESVQSWYVRPLP